MTSIDYSVNQVIEGLVQLHEFKDAGLKKTLGFERIFHFWIEFLDTSCSLDTLDSLPTISLVSSVRHQSKHQQKF
jgi:hypothetical protein